MEPLRLQAEIEIDAPPERVWQVLTDFAAYSEWNPFVLSVVGQLKEHSTVTIRPGLPEGDETAYDAEVVKNVPSRPARGSRKKTVRQKGPRASRGHLTSLLRREHSYPSAR